MHRQRVEEDIASLIRKSNRYFLVMSSINEDIANRGMGAGNLYALEDWREKQAKKVNAIKAQLRSIQRETLINKQNYNEILTKYIVAQGTANQQQNIPTSLNEEQKISSALDKLLLIPMLDLWP